MKRLVVTVTVCMFAAVPMTAEAAPFPSRLNFAYDLAVEYWGQQPAACASIDRQIVPPGSLGNPQIGAISGRATHTPTGAAPGSIKCSLWIDRAYAEPIIFDLLCAVMVHNVGHLLGMEYSSDPRDAMHPSIPIPQVCKTKGRQSARLYLLRMKFHWLQTRSGDKAQQMRQRTLRALSEAARRFWG